MLSCLWHCCARSVRAVRPPEDCGSRPRLDKVLRLDGPGRALCARCGRSTYVVAALERYRCEAAWRWLAWVESANAPAWVRARVAVAGGAAPGGGG